MGIFLELWNDGPAGGLGGDWDESMSVGLRMERVILCLE